MNVRTWLVTIVAAVAATAAPAYATPPVDCAGLTERDASNDPGEPAPLRVGLCVEGQGYVEAGVALCPIENPRCCPPRLMPVCGVYVVASHDQLGYVGVSNYESTPSDPRWCDSGSAEGSGSNSGGCYFVAGLTVDLTPFGEFVPLPVCGNTSGAWYSSQTNGCRVDTPVDGTVAAAVETAACIQASPALVVDCLLAFRR